MKARYDVVIIGAGPAGCCAAAFLAEYGYEVLLIDKSRFPRDKTCGDGIGPLALEILDRLGMTEGLERENPWKVRGVTMSSPEGSLLRAKFPEGDGHRSGGYVMERRDFDYILLRQVQTRSNVDFLEECEVKGLNYRDDKVSGIRFEVKRKTCRLDAGVVVGADGAHSVVARELLSGSWRNRTLVFAVRAYFHDVQGLDDHVEIHCEKSILPGYMWIFPIGENKANVGCGSVGPSITRGNFAAFFIDLTKTNDLIKEKLAGARMVEDSLKGWPIPLLSCFTKRGRGNLLLIGDAGGFADPVTGEGIYQALKSAECAAKAIDMGLNRGRGEGRIAYIYERLWRKTLKRREYLIAHFIQRFLLKPSFLNINVKRATQRPAMGRRLAEILCHQRSKMRLII
jgi:geranylgeranyl reductase family protein